MSNLSRSVFWTVCKPHGAHKTSSQTEALEYASGHRLAGCIDPIEVWDTRDPTTPVWSEAVTA